MPTLAPLTHAVGRRACAKDDDGLGEGTTLEDKWNDHLGFTREI